MENFSDLGTARAVGRETLWPETYGESRDSQSPLRVAPTDQGATEICRFSLQVHQVADAEEFAAIGAGDAGIGGQAVEVIESFSWSPWR